MFWGVGSGIVGGGCKAHMWWLVTQLGSQGAKGHMEESVRRRVSELRLKKTIMVLAPGRAAWRKLLRAPKHCNIPAVDCRILFLPWCLSEAASVARVGGKGMGFLWKSQCYMALMLYIFGLVLLACSSGCHESHPNIKWKTGNGNIKRLLLIKEKNQTSQVNEFSTFLCMGRQESGLTEIIPLICTLTSWGQYPVVFHPESLRVHSRG